MKNQKLKKITRYNFFQMRINPRGSHLKEDIKEEETLEEIGFINQSELEDLLENTSINESDFSFSIKSVKKTLVTLKDYKGQLERDSKSKKPRWQLIVQTSRQVSKKLLILYYSNELFNRPDPSIQIDPIENIKSLNDYEFQEARLKLDQPYSPGFLSKSLIDFKKNFPEFKKEFS